MTAEGAGVVLCSGRVRRPHFSSPFHSGQRKSLETVPREGQDLPKGTQHVGGRVGVYASAPVSRASHPPSGMSTLRPQGRELGGWGWQKMCQALNLASKEELDAEMPVSIPAM